MYKLIFNFLILFKIILINILPVKGINTEKDNLNLENKNYWNCQDNKTFFVCNYNDLFTKVRNYSI